MKKITILLIALMMIIVGLSGCTQRQAPNPLLHRKQPTRTWYLGTDFYIREGETKIFAVTSNIWKIRWEHIDGGYDFDATLRNREGAIFDFLDGVSGDREYNSIVSGQIDEAILNVQQNSQNGIWYVEIWMYSYG